MSDGVGGCRGARCCQDCINERTRSGPADRRTVFLAAHGDAVSVEAWPSFCPHRGAVGSKDWRWSPDSGPTAARECVRTCLWVRKKKGRKERTQVLEWVNVFFYCRFLSLNNFGSSQRWCHVKCWSAVDIFPLFLSVIFCQQSCNIVPLQKRITVKVLSCKPRSDFETMFGAAVIYCFKEKSTMSSFEPSWSYTWICCTWTFSFLHLLLSYYI